MRTLKFENSYAWTPAKEPRKGLIIRPGPSLSEHARRLPIGNPAKEQVALGPIIDGKQRDRIHAIVTSSVRAGASS